MKFKASMDAFTKGLTLVVLALFLWVSIMSYNKFPQHPTESIVGIIFMVLIALTTFCLRPINYFIGKDKLTIRRIINSIDIEISGIKNVRKLDAKEMVGVVREFGIGGLFSYTAKFGSSRIGDMRMFATRRANFVLVETQDEKFVLTPDDPEGFLTSLQTIINDHIKRGTPAKDF